MAVRRINLALQGGGAHGAFSWGVIERLLQEGSVEIAAISGTSAGALNGAALAAGLASGPGQAGRDAALENLDYIWAHIGQISDSRLGRWLYPPLDLPDAMQRLTDLVSPVAWLEGMARVFSPYDSGPFYSNPLHQILCDMPHPDFGNGAGPRLFVSATNVRTGRIRVFGQGEVTVDAILASACLPTLFRAVEIDDPRTGRREAYWDGGFSGNPALFPLFSPDLPRDVVIVTINPMLRDTVPQSPVEIQDRINEISFNASLLSELRAINFVKRLDDERRLRGRPMKNVLVHFVMDDFMMTSLSAQTKIIPRPGLVDELREAGRAAAERFLEYSGPNLGERDSVNLPALFA